VFPAPPAARPNDLADQQVFLQLLVAQLRNQNPLSPSDPIEFVSQLTQFTTLEQTIAMRQSLESIRDALAEAAPAQAEAGGETQL
jgi:flagellar basal-body rod modification protein FlgD